jgi:SulP family sulfate permease
VTVWAVLVPEAFAYATIAGVSPVVGLYAAPAALVLYALLGSSRQLVVGPMSATAALSAAAVAGLAGSAAEVAGLTAALALVTGAIALAAGLARLGFVSNLVSEPVLKGFIVGMAATIIVGQLPKVLGVEGSSGSFLDRSIDLLSHLGDTDAGTVAVGLACLAAVLVLRRVAPRAPASLVVVVLAVAVSTLADLEDHGIAVVGAIGSGLPSVGLPDVSWADCVSLSGSALGVVFVGFAEGLGAARTYAQQTHDEIDADRELIGLGAANLGAGLCQGMVVNGSLSKTAVNGAAGARSQVSGLVAAALTGATLFVTGLFEPLPEATLAAVVIAAVIDLVDVRALVGFARARSALAERVQGPAARADLLGAVAALVGVLVLDTLPGLLLGVAVSLLLLVVRSSRPYVAVLGRIDGSDRYADLARVPGGRPVPGLVIVRPEGPLFFANAQSIRRRVLDLVAAEVPVAVVVDAETVPSVDLTAAAMLRDLAGELGRRDVRLALARDIGQVRDLLGDAPADGTVESYPTVREAVAALTPGG